MIDRITGEVGAELLFSATQGAVRQVANSEHRYAAADMPNRVRVLMVPDADRAELERCARVKGASARVVERARIVLLAADGLTGAQMAARAGCTEPTVIKWRRRYAEAGLAGLEDAPRPVSVLDDPV